MHHARAVGRRMLLAASITFSFVGPGIAQQIPVDFDPRPKRDGSRQFVSYSLPRHWTRRTAEDISVYLFTHEGPAAGLEPTDFDEPRQLAYTRSRIAYESVPELHGRVAFLIAVYYRPLGELRHTGVQEIRFDRPVLGPVPRPGIYTRTQPALPRPNLDPRGDVYVDPVGGDDRNSGAWDAPRRTIDGGLARVRELFPTPEARAGRHLILRGGDYQASASPFDSVIELVDFQGGVPGDPFTIRGFPGETVRLRGYGGQRSYYYFAVELRGASHLTLENLVVDNASYMEGINLDMTRGVTLRFLEVYAFGSKWGAQAFGEFEDFLAEGCRFSGASGEHNVYVAAGTVEPGVLGRRIVFRGNQFDHASWWGLQINGTVQDVLIENNLFWENGLGPLAIKGASGVTIRNNTMAGNNRQLSIENYFDGTYWHRGYGPDPIGMGRGDVTGWWRTHFSTIGYIDIVYNTILVPERAAMQALGSGPDDRPAIVLVEFAGTDENGYPLAEPFKRVRINNNIVVSQRHEILSAQISEQERDSRYARMVEAFEVHDNLFHASRGPVSMLFVREPGGAPPRGGLGGGPPFRPDFTPPNGHLAGMEAVYETWRDNVFDQDPLFLHVPRTRSYLPGVFYDWKDIRYDGSLRVVPWSVAADRGTLATYSDGSRQLLFTDRDGKRRYRRPDLGARESHDE